jgi:pimeloyl-ACP methyl ester carboxylesterase
MRKSFVVISLTASLGLADCSAGAAPLPVDAGRYYQVDGVKLYTEISGTGPPILFLHGGLSSFDTSFARQRAYFSAFRTVIGVDQRGHGHSPDNERAFSYPEMADNTAALIQRLGFGSVDIVGHSDGGNVGLLLARRHPELVRRLVISGANIRGDYDGLWAYVRFRLASTDRFAESLPPALREDYARVSPDGGAHWLTVVGKSKDLWSTWVVLEPSDLRAIRTPVLVMAGDHDVISLEHALEIYRALPHGQLCILPASGHATMQDRSDEFNRLSRAFLEGPAPH